MPDDLAHQWARAPALYEALGWTVVDSEDLEADDLLGTLAAEEEAAGGAALILTGDRDMFQCATDARPRPAAARGRGRAAGARAGRGAASATASSRPRCRTSSRCAAIRRTASPAAKGIGEKTAADLLRRHGTLEAALAGAGA